MGFSCVAVCHPFLVWACLLVGMARCCAVSANLCPSSRSTPHDCRYRVYVWVHVLESLSVSLCLFVCVCCCVCQVVMAKSLLLRESKGALQLNERSSLDWAEAVVLLDNTLKEKDADAEVIQMLEDDLASKRAEVRVIAGYSLIVTCSSNPVLTCACAFD